jgi:hypothetical protein
MKLCLLQALHMWHKVLRFLSKVVSSKVVSSNVVSSNVVLSNVVSSKNIFV